ncbi:mercury transporter MerT [Noviherbaspirillum sp. DKR-6]|uniref:Mercuric transport protein MerT n=1 Tax=Noviherbaspirillum pedocola TaxID=2801341 RepID=A0A934SPD5_9BURK|nr:mercuric transporter MerT family protein [Noviherbaspirillum pedocola]MBK4733009.1 mercury transporter MerT [Noviherbaspirillum pedocola]
MLFWDSKRSLAVGVLAAIGASVCCVGPLLLLTLGIGGAWISNLVAFEPYRPLFIGLTVLFFAMAFRRLYLVKQVCSPGQACAIPVVVKRQRAIFWVVTVFIIGLLAFPAVAPLFI